MARDSTIWQGGEVTSSDVLVEHRDGFAHIVAEGVGRGGIDPDALERLLPLFLRRRVFARGGQDAPGQQFT